MNSRPFPDSKRIINLLRIFSFPIESNRIYGLDILRAIAIFFVVLLHGTLLLPDYITTLIKPFILDGVTIFFVLSGFLIGTILIKTLEEKFATFKTLQSFWLKRWFRTLPAYFVVLTLLCLLSFLFDPAFKFSETIRYFFFLQNFGTQQPPFFGESWSLSVEEWFYLLVPIILFVTKYSTRLPARKIMLFSSLLIIILVTGFRFYGYLKMDIDTIHDWQVFIQKQVITRLDGIMFGVLGAYVSYYKKGLWVKSKNICFAIGIILLVAVRFSEMNVPLKLMKIYMCVFYFSFYQLAVLFLLPVLTQIKTGKGFVFRLITTISVTSYSIYLLHFSLVKGWIVDRFFWFGLKGIPYLLARYSFYWIFTILLSILAYKYFERPVMDLRKKFVR